MMAVGTRSGSLPALAGAALLVGCGSAADAVAVLSQGRAPDHTMPLHTVGGFSVTLPPVTLMPGAELQPCWLLPIDIQGASHVVGGGVLTTQPGMHHGNLTSHKKTGDGVRVCTAEETATGTSALDIAMGGAVLFASSTQVKGSEWRRFPDGMGFRVPDGHEIVARLHYLNATNKPLTVAPTYQWFTIDESQVTRPLAPFAWAYVRFMIPPLATYTVTATCEFPRPMHVVELLPHMHRLGKALDAAFFGGPLDGKRFLESPGYDPDNGVLREYDPPIDLSQGLGARFSCTWNNTFDRVISEGVGDNEMCILFGYAYPPSGAYTVLAAPNGSCVGGTPP